MTWNLLGFLVLGGAALIGAVAIGGRPGFPFPQKLFVGAVALRLVGSTARYEVLQRLYDGVGDASGYYASGWILAQRVWHLDFAVFSGEQWLGGAQSWWGTSAIRNLSGIVLSVIGPTMRGEFLFFSLLSFSGLVLMALAVARLADRRTAAAFAALVWFWPSLWFWPASVGKESVIVLAFGLVVYGFAGNGERMGWLPFLAGLGIAFAIRPHVALALAAATGIGLWLGSRRRLTPGQLAQGAVLALVLLLTFRGLGTEFGLLDADLEGVQEFVSYRAQQTLLGGSSLGAVPSGIGALPMAFINIWMRPLPWDIHNAMAALSAIEVAILWTLLWRRRRELRLGLANWRRHRLLQFAVPFLIGYTLMIGFTFGNLGIIARQRSPLFPFVFLLLCSSALLASRRRPEPLPEPVPIARRRKGPIETQADTQPPGEVRQWARR